MLGCVVAVLHFVSLANDETQVKPPRLCPVKKGQGGRKEWRNLNEMKGVVQSALLAFIMRWGGCLLLGFVVFGCDGNGSRWLWRSWKQWVRWWVFSVMRLITSVPLLLRPLVVRYVRGCGRYVCSARLRRAISGMG